ncbi:MAG TPA: YdjY domain-containing protein, partial [Planctomycetaceae bacterium]
DNKLKELSWYGPMTVEHKVEFLALSDDKAFQAMIESFFEQSQPRDMEADWVFAGSQIYKDEETGKEHYLAEDGDLICVANFGSAMIDVASNSSAENSDLNFEAWTDRIPPKGTPVTLELIPVAPPVEKADPKKVPSKTKTGAE